MHKQYMIRLADKFSNFKLVASVIFVLEIVLLYRSSNILNLIQIVWFALPIATQLNYKKMMLNLFSCNSSYSILL